jgi:hypothetical protein
MWPWSYNYLCNQCLSPLMLWVRISIRARCTTLCDKVCQWLATGRLFSPGLPVSSTKKWPPRYNWNIVESGVKQQSCKNWWTAWQSCWRSLLIISIISSTITGRSESVHFWHLMIAGCIVTECWGNGLPGSHFVKSNIRLWVYLMNVIPETRREH